MRPSAASQHDVAISGELELVRHVAHELRTPLASVLAYAHVIQLDAHGASAVASAREIKQAVTHMLGLIDEYALAPEHAGVHASEAVDLQDAIERATALIQPLASERSVAVDALCPACAVLFDAGRLQQVLLNLLSNAVKYNRRGGLVAVRVRPIGREVHVDVSDTGAGLTHAQQGRLFQPYTRLGADLAEVDGAGLGLYISKRLVEESGGRIELWSRPGSGTVVTTTLARA